MRLLRNFMQRVRSLKNELSSFPRVWSAMIAPFSCCPSRRNMKILLDKLQRLHGFYVRFRRIVVVLVSTISFPTTAGAWGNAPYRRGRCPRRHLSPCKEWIDTILLTYKLCGLVSRYKRNQDSDEWKVPIGTFSSLHPIGCNQMPRYSRFHSGNQKRYHYLCVHFRRIIVVPVQFNLL